MKANEPPFSCCSTASALQSLLAMATTLISLLDKRVAALRAASGPEREPPDLGAKRTGQRTLPCPARGLISEICCVVVFARVVRHISRLGLFCAQPARTA